jgi:hypothetical protein
LVVVSGECGRPHHQTLRAPVRAQSAGSAAYLEVQQVGDYKVRFAPSWPDLDRADPRVFKLSERLKKVMTEHYPAEEFGFVIYKPDHGGEMHPLAYRHPIRQEGALFVPTRHEHGHDGPPDWDHHIYHQGDADGIRCTKRDVTQTPAGETFAAAKEKGLPLPVEVDLDQPLRKLSRQDFFPNEDLEIGPEPAGSRSSLIGAAAAGGAAAAAGYFWLRRRRPLSGE